MFDQTLARATSRWRNATELAFRIGLSLIFIVGGLGHFFRSGDMLARIAESPWAPVVALFGNPLIHLWWTGAVFVIAGLALAAGYSTRLAAAALFLALLPVTVTIHIVPDAAHVGPLFKNVAILGALLHFFVEGTRCCGLDARRAQ